MGAENGSAWSRWSAAERDNRDEEAESALRSAFVTVPRHDPGDRFAANVSAAVADAARRQARVARVLLTAGAFTGLALTVGLLAFLPRLFRPAVDAGIGGLVWMIGAVERGLDVWAILAQISRTTAAMLVSPQVTTVLIALGVIAIVALYGLNRMLELEERSSS